MIYICGATMRKVRGQWRCLSRWHRDSIARLTKPQRGYVRASDSLFEAGERP